MVSGISGAPKLTRRRSAPLCQEQRRQLLAGRLLVAQQAVDASVGRSHQQMLARALSLSNTLWEERRKGRGRILSFCELSRRGEKANSASPHQTSASNALKHRVWRQAASFPMQSDMLAASIASYRRVIASLLKKARGACEAVVQEESNVIEESKQVQSLMSKIRATPKSLMTPRLRCVAAASALTRITNPRPACLPHAPSRALLRLSRCQISPAACDLGRLQALRASPP